MTLSLFRHRHPARALILALLAVLVAAPAVAYAAKRYPVNASGTVKLHHREPKTKIIEQRGTVRGTPFGSGQLVLRSRLAARKKLEFSVKLTTPKGTVWGNGSADLAAAGSSAKYAGTLKILRGSGSYRKISRSRLKVRGNGDTTARTTTVRITGNVKY